MDKPKSKYNDFIEDVLELADNKYKMNANEFLNGLNIIILMFEQSGKIFQEGHGP